MRDRAARRDCNRAARLWTKGFEALFQIIERRPHPLEKPLAFRRQGKVLAAPLEEVSSQMILQSLDSSANGCLGDVELTPGAGKVHMPAGGIEHAESLKRNMAEHHAT